jgi:hypothetical protein
MVAITCHKRLLSRSDSGLPRAVAGSTVKRNTWRLFGLLLQSDRLVECEPVT